MVALTLYSHFHDTIKPEERSFISKFSNKNKIIFFSENLISKIMFELVQPHSQRDILISKNKKNKRNTKDFHYFHLNDGKSTVSSAT